MRYAQGHKEGVRARIIGAASRALRREGLETVSIPKLMKAAGLTHGGFYAHFRDRDELLAEAVVQAAQDGVLNDDEAGTEAFDAYLSKEHVRHPEHGCVIAALGPDGARQAEPVRKAFAEVVRGFLRRVEQMLHPKASKGAVSDEALAAASRMVGAIVLARLVQDEALAERILDAAKGSRGG